MCTSQYSSIVDSRLGRSREKKLAEYLSVLLMNSKKKFETIWGKVNAQWVGY